MTISLARLMKIKKLLVGKIVATQGEITQYNSVVSGTSRPLDISDLVKKLDAMLEALIALKQTQAVANQSITKKLFELAESKSLVTFWTRLSTNDGDSGQVNYGTNTKLVYDATIKHADKQARIQAVSTRIDDLQEQIDDFNYSTKVDVSEGLLAILGLKR